MHQLLAPLVSLVLAGSVILNPMVPPLTSDAGQPTAPAEAPAEAPAQAPAEAPAEPHAGPQPRLAILVYHQVDSRFSNPYTVTPAQFESHVTMLKEEGYTFYRLADVERLLSGEEGLPERGVLLAFDDGYSSFYSDVFPIAQEHGVPVTCFVVTRFLERVDPLAQPHMTAYQMQDLAQSPLVDLGGHSHDGHRLAPTAEGTQPVLAHRVLVGETGEPETEAEYQDRVAADFIRNAQLLREQGITTGLSHFTFPYTARSPEAVKLGQAAGFRYFYVGGERLVTPQTDPTEIPRVNAGAPDITAELLREHLRHLFAQP